MNKSVLSGPVLRASDEREPGHRPVSIADLKSTESLIAAVSTKHGVAAGKVRRSLCDLWFHGCDGEALGPACEWMESPLQRNETLVVSESTAMDPFDPVERAVQEVQVAVLSRGLHFNRGVLYFPVDD